jgi:alkylated DNA repair dioxygenase AlkB
MTGTLASPEVEAAATNPATTNSTSTTTTVSAAGGAKTLPLHIPHPSTAAPCCIPDELCPRNEANEIVRIHGLRYYRNFLSPAEQEHLLTVLYDHPWQKILARRQQFYGEVYYHTAYKNKLLQPSTSSSSSSGMKKPIAKEQSNVQGKKEEGYVDDDHKLDHKDELPFSLDIDDLLPLVQPKCQEFFNPEDGFPSQILVNEYLNNLGIASHFEDYDAFGSIILTISLVSPIYMTLKKPKVRTNQCHEYWDIQKILLEPGSLLILEDEARFDYRHGISKYKWVYVPGQEPICRDDSYRRVSLTMRHLLQSRRTVDRSDDESQGWRYRDSTKERRRDEHQM